MRLTAVERTRSPLGAGRTRLVGRVEFVTTGIGDETIWFDLEDRFVDGLSVSGNPWLAGLLPLAVTLGEPMELPLPVDPALHEGALALMEVWARWYPERQPVVLDVGDVATVAAPTPERTGILFSAGLDSFHTLLRHCPSGEAIRRFPIDDLLTVWGLDVPLGHAEAFARVAGQVGEIAAATGTTSVTMATNLRESEWNRANWGLMGQGPALAALALVLEGRFARILVPSSTRYGSDRAWGTHPLTDPLLSTTTLDFRNDGAHHGRWEKAQAVSRSDLAMGHLRVCWVGGNERNCGRCEKCLRTLTLFEFLGVRDRATTFPAEAWSLEALAGLRYRNALDRRYQGRMAERAIGLGRPDVARAIRRAMRRYDTRRFLGSVARRLGVHR